MVGQMTIWGATEIPDQRGRIAVVTGANSGIGLETTRELARSGVSVVMACRSRDRGEQARAELLQSSPRQRFSNDQLKLSIAELDLTSSDSVARFVDGFVEDFDKLDLLINNAGVMACPPTLTAHGVERQWASNHLGHFALTGLLLPQLSKSGAGRVVSVSSLAAAGGDLSQPIPTDLENYSRFQVYSDTKLANQVFAVELNHRLAAERHRAISVAAHPGITHTNLAAGVAIPVLSPALLRVSRLLTQPAAVGALPTLRAATDPRVEGGQYYGPSGRNQRRGPPQQIPLVAGASRRILGRELWERSMELTGVRYLTGDGLAG